MRGGEAVFKISGGSFSYRDTLVLKDINLNINSGKFYGLIGPNGTGKTTLLDILMGNLELQEGSNLFKGSPIKKYKNQELAKMLALVPQDYSMGFSYSVLDVVLMGRHPHIPRFSRPSTEDYETIEEAMRILDISHLRNRPVTDLSGGEKQRVVVARALAQQTEVLILDEATSNLDIQHTIEIMRVIRKRVEEDATTVVAAIHDLNLASAFCDELIVLKDRRVHSTGPVSSVLTTDLLADVFRVSGKIETDCTNQKPHVIFELLQPRN